MGSEQNLRMSQMPAAAVVLLSSKGVETYTNGILTANTLAKYRSKNIGPKYHKNPDSGRVYYTQEIIDQYLTSRLYSGTSESGRKRKRNSDAPGKGR